MSDLVLSPDELVALTGYRRAADQLRKLHSLGFYRARVGSVTRTVILERAHYATEGQTAGYVRHRKAQRTEATK